MQRNALDDLRNELYSNSFIYKDKTKKWYDTRLRGNKEFVVGQKVLLFNSCMRLFLGWTFHSEISTPTFSG